MKVPDGGSVRRRAQGGFTLVEVLVALGILGTTAVLLLHRRVEIVREAAWSRDVRTAWMLASRKMAELELDRALWTGVGGSAAGDFGQDDAAYAGFTWEYLAARRPIPLEDPNLPKDKVSWKLRELFHLTLRIGIPDVEEPIVLESFFPIASSQGEAEEDAPPPGGEKPEGTPAGRDPDAPPPAGNPSREGSP
ncbi:MAG TPA: prepilin-type N-terminal cleavage/methylation domain-containing protein [Planctomycetota bacterium]|nr:prepilin-type N-terminal cleavage/methylation domain-containing protein [Planctomycetota bacterium]